MEIKLRNPLSVKMNISFFNNFDTNFYYSNKNIYMWWQPTQNDNYVNLKCITIFNRNKDIILYLPNKIKYKNKIYNVWLCPKYKSFEDFCNVVP